MKVKIDLPTATVQGWGDGLPPINGTTIFNLSFTDNQLMDNYTYTQSVAGVFNESDFHKIVPLWNYDGLATRQGKVFGMLDYIRAQLTEAQYFTFEQDIRVPLQSYLNGTNYLIAWITSTTNATYGITAGAGGNGFRSKSYYTSARQAKLLTLLI